MLDWKNHIHNGFTINSSDFRRTFEIMKRATTMTEILILCAPCDHLGTFQLRRKPINGWRTIFLCYLFCYCFFFQLFTTGAASSVDRHTWHYKIATGRQNARLNYKCSSASSFRRKLYHHTATRYVFNSGTLGFAKTLGFKNNALFGVIESL